MAVARTYYTSTKWSSRGTAAQRMAEIMLFGDAPSGLRLSAYGRSYRKASGALVVAVDQDNERVNQFTGEVYYVRGHENICQHVRHVLRGWTGVELTQRSRTYDRPEYNTPITETHTLVLISPDAQPGIYTPQQSFKYCLKRIQQYMAEQYTRLATLRQLLELAGLADAPQGIQADYLEERGLTQEAAQHRMAF